MSARCTSAIIFDFDGVLVESTDVKTEAFAAIYREHGAQVVAQAVAYHLAHAGVSRFIKFRHLHRTLLGHELSDAELDRLGGQFAQRVVESVVAAPWVAGAREFVEAHHLDFALFIASGTPDAELKTIVQRRGMERFFRQVRGVPATKGEIITGIIREHRYAPQEVLMVGDAAADLEGARFGGTRFVGRAHPGAHPLPPGVPVVGSSRVDLQACKLEYSIVSPK